VLGKSLNVVGKEDRDEFVDEGSVSDGDGLKLLHEETVGFAVVCLSEDVEVEECIDSGGEKCGIGVFCFGARELRLGFKPGVEVVLKEGLV